ncbi:pyridoxamine 5'-phosphate oxidase family protein [Actinophytocola sp.]|uniref:pyridoxamine 5'-phosphate oxidase family protein n=1 Tax=Actinophytocola sp. TaxID=1872138 RepID=UPI0025B91540|nr:pyridoxamine 5'-phosphate oxidase family protein [Actinophytocola sp.]
MTNDDIARAVLDGTSYVVLATADAAGLPWASPVWFAHEDPRELFWVSFPGARHSRNLADRPELAMVVFDSTRPSAGAQAVYMSATAGQVTDPAEIERGIGVFSRVSVREGLEPWGPDRVTGGARLRLYRAQVTEHSILDPGATVDIRTTVRP